MGECSKEQSFALLDAFFDLGGNFLDTWGAVITDSIELTLTRTQCEQLSAGGIGALDWGVDEGAS